MRLIFDENLSPKLPHRVAGVFPEATHIESLGLKGEDDFSIWEFTKRIKDSIIVSKYDDFRELALLYGSPPKVILLQLGNCSTRQIKTLLLDRYSQIVDFYNNSELVLLELY